MFPSRRVSQNDDSAEFSAPFPLIPGAAKRRHSHDAFLLQLQALTWLSAHVDMQSEDFQTTSENVSVGISPERLLSRFGQNSKDAPRERCCCQG